MNFQRKLCVTLGITFFVTGPLILLAFQEGPDPGNTAAPGENPSACARLGCHVGVPTVGSGVEVTFAAGLSYTPGVKQTFTVKVTPQNGLTPNGFQLSIRPVSDANTQAGELTPTDARTQVICQDGKPSKPCNQTFPVQFIEHTFAGSAGSSWTFDWTPPATNVGAISVYVAGNAANGNGSSDGNDRIFLNSYTLTPQASTPAPKLSATAPVIQSFLGGTRMSPGAWIEINGTNLAPSVKVWTDLLGNNIAPTTINGVSVNVDGKAAFLSLISPDLIKAQVPDGVGLGQVPVEVVTDGGRVSTSITATITSPALYTTPAFNLAGVQYVGALFSDGAVAGKEGLAQGSRPPKPGEIIVLFAVGCGSTNPPSPAGAVVDGLRTIPNIQVMFGQTVATASAYMSPQSIGLCQFNVTVPNVAAGDYAVEATVNSIKTDQNLKITVGQ